MNIIAGLSEIATNLGSSKLSLDHIARLAAPNSVTDQDLAKLRRDCEIVAARLQASPEKLKSLIQSGIGGDLVASSEIIQELKLTEEDFEREGGGFAWLVLLLVVLIIGGAAVKKH
jgi:hypothetical protein